MARYANDGTTEYSYRAVESSAPENYEVSYETGSGKAAITNTLKPGSITIKKLDQDGNPLLGAEFEVAGGFLDSAEKSKYVTPDGKSVAELTGLAVGNAYEIQETKAPDGCDSLEGKFVFAIDSEGHVDSPDALAGECQREPGYYVSEDGLSLIVVNKKDIGAGGEDPDSPGGGEEPDNPGGGENPGDSDDPDNPDDPDGPADPDEPGEPEDPDGPDAPDVPDTPDTSGESTGPNEFGGTVEPGDAAQFETPGTGDQTNAGLPVVVGVGGVALAVAAVVVRRRLRS